MAQCTRLKNCDVSRNNLTELNPAMGALSRLRNLTASHNQIVTFPSFVCQLASLDYLDLSHNKIEVLPDSLESLKVVELNLNQNNLTELPSSLAQCSRLKVLRVEQNTLSLAGIPTVLLTDSKVSLLAVEGNNFSLKEIEEMGGYDKVRRLYFSSITGLLSSTWRDTRRRKENWIKI